MSLPPTAGTNAATIAGQLREAIVKGTYAHGQRLPAERLLARHFGASRSTIRAALRQLEDMALVIRRIGSGTFVNRPDEAGEEQIAELTSPLELMDVRQALEPQMVRLAVLHATPRDVETLAEWLAALEACGADQAAFSRADEGFHLTLAKMTGNPLMIAVYRRVNTVRSHSQWLEIRRKVLTADNIAAYNVQHRAVFEAIRRRDMEAAVRAITEHLDKARRHLLGAATHDMG